MLTTYLNPRLPLLLLAALALTGCPGGDDGEDPADETPPQGGEPPAELFTIGGTATGIGGAELIVFMDYDTEAGLDHQSAVLTDDGAFTFPTAVPDGTEYTLLEPGALLDPPRLCEIENRTGTVDGADVTNIGVTCEPGYTVGITVSGLESPEITVQVNEQLIRFVAGNSYYDQHTVLRDGESYEVTVAEFPTNPEQSCRVENGSGVIAGANVTNVEVICGSNTVSFTVDGLVGSGLSVSLASDVIGADGNPAMLVLKHMEVAEDGEYTFDWLLAPGDPYQVGIWQQPSDPDQECTVENGSGTIEGDVTDVVVLCPKPYRYYRYDDSYTKWHAVPSDLVDPADPDPPATPLEDGEQFGGALHDDHIFGHGPAVPLGAVSGLGSQDLFARYLDAEPAGVSEAIGVVHSNSTGKTYWLAVESPQGVPPISASADPTGTVLLGSNYVTLETWWKYRKIDQASFRLEITRAELLGFDNRDHWFTYEPGEQPAGTLRATVDLRIRAFKAGAGDALDDVGSETGGEEGDVFAEVFFDTHGRMDLIGRGEPCVGEDDCDDETWPAKWSLEPEVRAEALSSLWATDDDGNPLTSNFELETSAYSAGEDQVALARLAESIVVEIDLSSIPVGEEFIVLSEAWVRGHNTYSPEGGAAAYLRDPASFEPEEGTEGADHGVTVETSGLVMIDFDSLPEELDELHAASPPPPPACDAGNEASSELAFDAASYLQAESRESRAPIRITRGGSTEGSVTARVRLTGGSAVAGEDFEPTDLVVRFGPGSNAARTLELPIIEDAQSEADETLTLDLVEPEGCAVIGAQGTAQVTIIDDDVFPGSIAFSVEGFDVDEGAGTATISLVRTGGDAGEAIVRVESADGSATGSAGGDADYIPLATQITFADGDTGPHDVLVPIVDDLVTESDETVSFTLDAVSGAVGAPADAVLTIRDNDQGQASTVQFTAAQYAASETDGVAPITISRYGDVSGTASVTLSTNDGTAIAGQDYETLQTTVMFAAGDAAIKLPEVVVLADSAAEPDETILLALSDPTGVGLGTPSAAELVITENEGEPTWQDDIEIDAAAGTANDAQIAFDGNGNAIALWYQANGIGGTDIWWNFHTAGVGWGTALPIEQNGPDMIAGSPRVGFDAAGNALAVWTLYDDAAGTSSVRGSLYTPGTGWSTPDFIENEAGDVLGTVELAVNASGNALAAWVQFDGTFMNVWSNRYSAGTGWGATAEIVDESDAVVDDPHVAIDGQGNGLVVWEMPETGSPATDVWARRHTAVNGWEASKLLSTNNDFNAGSARAATDAAGNATIVWVQGVGIDSGLYATRYIDGSGWEPAPVLLGISESIEAPRIAVDPAGNVMSVWKQRDVATGQMTAYGSRFTAATGWDIPQPISDGEPFYPKIALDASGNGIAAWFELDLSLPSGSGYSVWSNRYTNGSGWAAAAQIGSNGGLIGTGMPNIAIDTDGNAFVIWTRDGEVRVNRYE